MLSLSAIHRLQTQHLAIPEIIALLSSAQLQVRPGNKWSVQENIAHLLCYQKAFSARIDKILSEESPHFGRYKAEEDPVFESVRKSATQELLAGLNQERALLNEKLSHLAPEQILRRGIHPLHGNLPLSQWTEFFLLHEAHHLYTIFQLVHQLKQE